MYSPPTFSSINHFLPTQTPLIGPCTPPSLPYIGHLLPPLSTPPSPMIEKDYHCNPLSPPFLPYNVNRLSPLTLPLLERTTRHTQQTSTNLLIKDVHYPTINTMNPLLTPSTMLTIASISVPNMRPLSDMNGYNDLTKSSLSNTNTPRLNLNVSLGNVSVLESLRLPVQSVVLNCQMMSSNKCWDYTQTNLLDQFEIDTKFLQYITVFSRSMMIYMHEKFQLVSLPLTCNFNHDNMNYIVYTNTSYVLLLHNLFMFKEFLGVPSRIEQIYIIQNIYNNMKLDVTDILITIDKALFVIPDSFNRYYTLGILLEPYIPMLSHTMLNSIIKYILSDASE